MLLAVAQLDGSRYASINCGPAIAASCVAFDSYNAITPTPSEMRTAGNMGTGYTDLGDVKRAVESFADEFAAEGLSAPKVTRLGFINEAALLDTLVNRRALHMFPIKYGVILGTPYASDDDFTGGHFVAATRLYRPRPEGGYHRVRRWELEKLIAADKTDSLWTVVLDPLADGRWSSRLGRRVAAGPQLWPLPLLTRAADAMSGMDGKFSTAVTYRAEKV